MGKKLNKNVFFPLFFEVRLINFSRRDKIERGPILILKIDNSNTIYSISIDLFFE